MKKRFLAGLAQAEFLRRHWQKKPLFAPAALPAYAGAITRDALLELSTRDDVESRIVTRTRGRWTVRHGPFNRRELSRLPHRNWTLLVQGVDQHLPQAARLLREFAFIPHARMDDVMVSYAAPGGGVGPHYDSYDVFLVQCSGVRRWRLSGQRDLALVPDAPLRILSAFEPEHEWTAAAGDVLYLPPRWAHDGVALDECITCSVGFRAPDDQQLASRFLDYLEDRLELQGRYADPGLEPTRQPGRIPDALVDHAVRVASRLRWTKADVAAFTGCYLSEPKADVSFERPHPAIKPGAFARRAKSRGISLAPASRMLFDAKRIYLNGESVVAARAASRTLKRLADARELEPPLELDTETLGLLYEWYAAGYIRLR